MAIQGTQVLMYTNTHYFCIFLNFQKKINEKQNKAKIKTKTKKQKTKKQKKKKTC